MGVEPSKEIHSLFNIVTSQEDHAACFKPNNKFTEVT